MRNIIKIKHIASLCVLLMIGCGEEEQDSAPEPANVNANPGGGSSNAKLGLGEACTTPPEFWLLDNSVNPCQAGLWCSSALAGVFEEGTSTICRKLCSSYAECDGIGLQLCVSPPEDSVTCVPGSGGQGLCAMSDADLNGHPSGFQNAICE